MESCALAGTICRNPFWIPRSYFSPIFDSISRTATHDQAPPSLPSSSRLKAEWDGSKGRLNIHSGPSGDPLMQTTLSTRRSPSLQSRAGETQALPSREEKNEKRPPHNPASQRNFLVFEGRMEGSQGGAGCSW